MPCFSVETANIGITSNVKVRYLIILAASKAVFRIGICMDPHHFFLAGSEFGSRLATMTYSKKEEKNEEMYCFEVLNFLF